MSVRPDPGKIVVPRGHGEVLIEPALGELVAAAKERLGAGVEREGVAAIFGMKDSELRHAARWRVLGGDGDVDVPLVMTGHQLEFYHAGVWAKVIVADAVARRSGGVAIDLLVDHDVVERRGIDVPVRDDASGAWRREAVLFDEASALSAEDLRAPGLAAFEEWDAELAKHRAASDSMTFFLSALRPRGEESYTQWLSQARLQFEQSMGLRVRHVPTSVACGGVAWDRFVHGWIECAERLTGVYNAQLAAYRGGAGIKSAQHPMPDLERDVSGGVFELPFWIHRPGLPRERLVVGRGWKWEREMSIRPRALTLTMFVRLFLADVFIHGIGGALYDQITDGILREVFGVVPAYGCVSAAWLLPFGRGEAEAGGDLPAARWWRHHLEHNPQQGIDAFTALRTDVAERIAERRELVERIGVSLRERRGERGERAAWFGRLHEVNRLLHEKVPKVLARAEEEIAEAQAAAARRKVTCWREWFFGLHSRESLEGLVQKIWLEEG